jgi:hypothetical protein
MRSLRPYRRWQARDPAPGAELRLPRESAANSTAPCLPFGTTLWFIDVRDVRARSPWAQKGDDDANWLPISPDNAQVRRAATCFVRVARDPTEVITDEQNTSAGDNTSIWIREPLRRCSGVMFRISRESRWRPNSLFDKRVLPPHNRPIAGYGKGGRCQNTLTTACRERLISSC